MGQNHPKITNEKIDELSKNNIIVFINKKVYNITPFLNKHPGGQSCFRKCNGLDVTTSYNFHSSGAQKIWDKYYLGKKE